MKKLSLAIAEIAHIAGTYEYSGIDYTDSRELMETFVSWAIEFINSFDPVKDEGYYMDKIEDFTIQKMKESMEVDRFDYLEVHGCVELGGGFVEQTTEDSEANFFSLYGHYPLGGLESLADFSCRAKAEQFAELFKNKFK